MARPTEQKADYFPHFVGGGKTLRALERTYGNDGYAFWFKLLETLCCTDGQCLNLLNDIERIDFSGYVMQTEERVLEIINLLVRLGQVDRDLWESNRRVWVQGLVDNLAPMYSKRSGGTPQKPAVGVVSGAETPMMESFRSGNPDDGEFPGISGSETPQRREEKSKEEKTKGEESISGVPPVPVATAPVTKPKPARFTPPTIEEVRDYCNERGKGVDPDKWHDFYASKGWMVGKNPMKDWKAAVRTWERSSNATPAPDSPEYKKAFFAARARGERGNPF